MNQELHPLLNECQSIGILKSVASVLEWDQAVFMPTQGLSHRSRQLSTIRGLAHSKQTSKDFAKLLGRHIDLKSGDIKTQNLSEMEIGLLRELYHDWKRSTQLPLKFIEKQSEVLSRGHHIWEGARKSQSYSEFVPILEEVIAVTKEMAAYINPHSNVYDILIHDYEPYVTTKDIDQVFGPLKTQLINLLQQLQTAQAPQDIFLGKKFAIKKQHELSQYVLKQMGLKSETSRLDYSTHPFSTGFHPKDVRITTRLDEVDFFTGLLSSIHEGGHALYELGLNEDYYGTPACQAVSYGMHESQSRFWEVFVAKSKSFCQANFPKVQELFPDQFAKYTVDQFYQSINIVKPGLIRVDADELTYGMHIFVRYDIEKAIFNNQVTVRELPELWNEKYQKYLGLTPPNDAVGVLQDVHWSGGAFGYFPTYLLGTLYAAQFHHTVENKVENIENKISQGNFGEIKSWLNKEIHQHGRTYPALELLKKVTGESLNSQYFIDFLTRKLGQIYGIH